MAYIDDVRVLIASRQEARQNFDAHRRLAVDTPMQIKHAVEVADLLRHNLVQGSREQGVEDARWGAFCSTPVAIYCRVIL